MDKHIPRSAAPWPPARIAVVRERRRTTRNLAAAEFDHDGRLDLAGENYGAWVLRQSGRGMFEPPIKVHGAWDDDIAAADLDGDTLPDLVVSDVYESDPKYVRVLRNVSSLIS